MIYLDLHEANIATYTKNSKENNNQIYQELEENIKHDLMTH